jgi:hypothetical protein
MIRNRDFSKFLRRYVVLLAIPGLIVAANILVVYRGGELTAYKDIVKRQGETQALFGAAFNQNAFGYKLAMVREVAPEVVALGSSRVMLFRKEDFTSSFVSAGGAGNFLNEIHDFIVQMSAFHKPKLLILGLDFWWFNPLYPEPTNYDYHLGTGTALDFDKLTKPFSYMFDRRMPPREYLRLLFSGGKKNPHNGFENYGLRAAVWCNGFRGDGSHLYGESAFGLNPNFFDKKFLDTLAGVDMGTGYFLHGPGLAPQRAEELRGILALCREQGIRVIVFLPPLAAPVYRAVLARGDDYAHFRELRARLPEIAAAYGAEAYDFTEVAEFGSSDCEFLDGYHGGDVAYARILAAILARNPASALAAYADAGKLRDNIERYAGRAVMNTPEELYRTREVDFLELGCPKSDSSKK